MASRRFPPHAEPYGVVQTSRHGEEHFSPRFEHLYSLELRPARVFGDHCSIPQRKASASILAD